MILECFEKQSDCYRELSSFHIADTFLLTVRSSGGGELPRPANQSNMSLTSSP
jgi:hypothetical protein